MQQALADGDRLARRNALILAVASALAGANASVVFATGAIVGSMLAPQPSLATVPVSVFVVGMASGTLPAGWLARRAGRRPVFLLGAFFGMLMGLIACVAVLRGSFALYCVGTFFGGLYQAISQSYRFSAADTASPAFRPKAISWVMVGGIFAGVIGPQMINATMNLWAPFLFAASYLAQAAVAVLAACVLLFVDIPKPPPVSAGTGRPLGEILRQRTFVTAAVTGVVSYALMNLVMTSAPLAMKMCGHDLSDSNLAIQWHVIAMYAPSFFTGALISRFGAPRLIGAGLLIIALSAVVGLMGITVAHFWIALILLGVGWNFGFVGATALVAECATPTERNRVQAVNDFLVFGTMAVGSFSSGHILASYGWATVNDVVFPPVVLGLAILVWNALRRPARVAQAG